jgi:erythronate-4-phosphate dehydrogenase
LGFADLKRSCLKIVVDDRIPFISGVLESFADVIYLPGGAISPGLIRDADALIVRTRTRCDEKLLANSKVRFIATATIGFDHLDVQYLQKVGIAWSNAPGCNASSVAQYIVSALATAEVDFLGKTLGVIGVGNVGSKVAAMGKTLGMRVILNDPPRAERENNANFTGLAELLRDSDFVTLHTPLTDDGKYPTRCLCNAKFLAQMKNSAQLFNTSRGEVVDSGTLIAALKTKTIAGAVLDVWEDEPGINRELLNSVRLGTPHIAGYSGDGKANGSAMVIQALAKFFGIDQLSNWTFGNLPKPKNPTIVINSELPEAQQLRQALLHSYNICEDDLKLRHDPAGFEAQRGNYPVRREYGAFTVQGGSEQVRKTLRQLGFTC